MELTSMHQYPLVSDAIHCSYSVSRIIFATVLSFSYVNSELLALNYEFVFLVHRFLDCTLEACHLSLRILCSHN